MIKRTFLLLFTLFFTACRGSSLIEEPPIVINEAEVSSESFITLRVDEIEILSNNGELVGEREFRLIVVGSNQSGRSASLTCPANEAVPIHVGETLTDPCPFGISIAENDIEGDLFYLIVALDEDKVNGATEFGIDYLLNLIAHGVGLAVSSEAVLPALAASGPAAIGGLLLLETAVGYGGGKLIDYGLREDEIGVQALRLQQQKNWFAGQQQEVISADGRMRLVFSIHQAHSPEEDAIVIVNDEKSYTVNLPANGSWYDTMIRLEKGQTISIVATGNAVTWSGDGVSQPEASGPDGQTYTCPDTQNPVVANVDCFMNNESYGTLIAKISDGTPFKVGSFYSGNSINSGTLYFVVNDNESFYEDNHGAYSITITIN